jgi:hypothetical protein
VDHPIPENASDPFPNTITASGQPSTGGNRVEASDIASVDLIDPKWTLSKTCSGPQGSTIIVGDPITWTIEACNTTGDTNVDVKLEFCVTDSVAGINDCEVVADGNCAVFPATRDTDLNDCGSLTNTADVKISLAEPDHLDNTWSGEVSSTCEVICNPNICVEKDVNPKVSKEECEVTYTLGPLCNCGELLLTDITVSDTVLDNVINVTNLFFPGTTPRTLEPGDCALDGATVDVDYTIPVGAPDPLDNIITAKGTPPVGPDVTDTDEASVDLIYPKWTFDIECAPDQMPIGDTMTWTIERCNTTVESVVDVVNLEICVNSPDLGINNDCKVLAKDECDTITVEDPNITDCGPISRTATATIKLVDPPVYPPSCAEWEDEDTAECDVWCPEVCRTPGYWGAHACPQHCPDDDPDAYCEHPRGRNITQAAIDACGGVLEICGTQITNTVMWAERVKGDMNEYSSDPESALEAICVRVQGVHERQLVRQLTAAGLNCCASNGNADCTDVSIEEIFQICNAVCEGTDSTYSVQECIFLIDCWNNGGGPVEMGGFWTCQPMYPSCHSMSLGICEDGTICTEANTISDWEGGLICDSDGSRCSQSPASSSKACSYARRNDCTPLDPGECSLDPSCP